MSSGDNIKAEEYGSASEPSVGVEEEKEELNNVKCAKCSRKARKDCVHTLCFKCCSSSYTDCEVHQGQREQANFRELVLSASTPEQKALQQKLHSRIHLSSNSNARGLQRQREPGFQYLGDTVVIWDIAQYGKDEKWKQDAIRKSVKRQGSRLVEKTSAAKSAGVCDLGTLHERRIKRFRRFIEKQYQQSLKSSETENP